MEPTFLNHLPPAAYIFQHRRFRPLLSRVVKRSRALLRPPHVLHVHARHDGGGVQLRGPLCQVGGHQQWHNSNYVCPFPSSGK